MKKFIRSYMHIPAIERKGGIVLLAICCLLVAVWLYLANSRPAGVDAAEKKKFQQAGSNFLSRHTTLKKDTASAGNEAAGKTLFAFDPNTLDSAGFIALGLKPHTTHLLLNWRRKGKHFKKPDDLKSLYTLKVKEYNRLKPYIAISQ